MPNSSAYFYTNSIGFYFKNFYGDKKSALFIFFISLYNVKKIFYKNLKVKSSIRADLFYGKFALFFQDFMSPFYIYLKSKYTLDYIEEDEDDFAPEFVKLRSSIEKYIFKTKKDNIVSDIIIGSDKTIQINIEVKNIKLTISSQ